MLTALMNPLDLTVNQLKRAAAIKQEVEALNKELGGILGVSGRSGAVAKKKRRIGISGRRNIAAAQKVRWAKLRAAKPAMLSVKPAVQAKKNVMSRATKAKLSAKLKAYWKAKKAGKR
jgi:hypothetical protein